MALDELLNAEFPAHSASGPPRAPLASPPGEARGICPRKLAQRVKGSWNGGSGPRRLPAPPRHGTCSRGAACLDFFLPGPPAWARAKLLQACLALCDPMDRSPPGSSVHGISQATVLEWVAMPSSRGSSQPRDPTPVSYVLHWQEGPLAPPGKPPRVVPSELSAVKDISPPSLKQSF